MGCEIFGFGRKFFLILFKEISVEFVKKDVSKKYVLIYCPQKKIQTKIITSIVITDSPLS